jgi:hypothetical protein
MASPQMCSGIPGELRDPLVVERGIMLVAQRNNRPPKVDGPPAVLTLHVRLVHLGKVVGGGQDRGSSAIAHHAVVVGESVMALKQLPDVVVHAEDGTRRRRRTGLLKSYRTRLVTGRGAGPNPREARSDDPVHAV